MSKIYIDILDDTYELPLLWKVEDYLRTFFVNYKLSTLDYFQNTEDWKPLISKVLGLDDDVLDRCNPEGIYHLVEIMKNIKLTTSLAKRMNFNNLTFGNFIDLDVYFFNNPLKYWRDILTILAPNENLDELYIHDLYSIYNSFLEWRLWLYKQYKGLFGWEEKDDRDENGDLLNTNITQIAGHWFNIVCVLSGEDVNKIDETTNQPLFKILNFLSRKKDRDQEELRLLKKTKIR